MAEHGAALPGLAIRNVDKINPILDAIAALERLTLAEIKDADDVLLGKLFHGTRHWNMLAESERRRRREAAKLPDRSASTQARERP